MKKLSSIDIVRAFYINNELLKDVFISNKKDSIKKNIKKILTKGNKISQRALIKYHLDNWHPRYDNYFNSSWTVEEIPLKDCGVWPKMGGLPYEATKGNVLETAEFVKKYLEDKNKLTLKTSRILYIEEMMKFAEEINKNIPIIVLKDEVIRHNKFSNQTNKKFKKCKYDIDDGNHRAIAQALLGEEKIIAFVGKRIYKSNILYY